MLNRHWSALSAVIVGAMLATTAGADTDWQKNHPRRTEVNSRLRNQNNRIRQDVRNGSLSKGQAAALHTQDHQVRQEERDMAAQNNSHITKTEQRALNQQENGISKSIPKN
jgi:primase-polymerase (primpol)-like protein